MYLLGVPFPILIVSPEYPTMHSAVDKQEMMSDNISTTVRSCHPY